MLLACTLDPRTKDLAIFKDGHEQIWAELRVQMVKEMEAQLQQEAAGSGQPAPVVPAHPAAAPAAAQPAAAQPAAQPAGHPAAAGQPAAAAQPRAEGAKKGSRLDRLLAATARRPAVALGAPALAARMVKLDTELANFRAEITIPLRDDIKFDTLGWWRDRQRVYPLLTQIMRRVLCIPGSLRAAAAPPQL